MRAYQVPAFHRRKFWQAQLDIAFGCTTERTRQAVNDGAYDASKRVEHWIWQRLEDSQQT